MNNESNNTKLDLLFNFEILFLVRPYIRQVTSFFYRKIVHNIVNLFKKLWYFIIHKHMTDQILEYNLLFLFVKIFL
jgi:hypothetical protein